MNTIMRILLLVLLVIYIVSPLDLAPGIVIDDVILAIMYFASGKKQISEIV